MRLPSILSGDSQLSKVTILFTGIPYTDLKATSATGEDLKIELNPIRAQQGYTAHIDLDVDTDNTAVVFARVPKFEPWTKPEDHEYASGQRYLLRHGNGAVEFVVREVAVGYLKLETPTLVQPSFWDAIETLEELFVDRLENEVVEKTPAFSRLTGPLVRYLRRGASNKK